MTTPLRATWSLKVSDQKEKSDLSSTFATEGEKTIDIKQGNLVELNEGIHQIRDHLNDLLTHWKDVVGDEGQNKSKNNVTMSQQNEEEDQDESSEGEDGLE